MIDEWLSGRSVERLLKTDLWDEAVADGLLPLLEAKARHVVGIDLSPEVVDMAKAHYPHLDGAVAEIRALPFEDGCFDCAVSLSTLDHFASDGDILRALDELRRVLRPRSHLVLTLDNLANPLIRLRNVLPFSWLNRAGLVPYYVGRTWTPRRLCRMLQRSGFQVLQTRAIMHCPRALAVAATRCLSGRASGPLQARFLRLLQSFEGLEKLPTRFLTGYFVAVHAVKRPVPHPLSDPAPDAC